MTAAFIRSIQIKIGNPVSYHTSIGVRQIAQYDDRQLVIDVTRNMSLKALPSAAVIKHSMTVFCFAEPRETVVAGIGLAVRQPCDGPHLLETGLFQKLFGIQSRIPFCQVKDREVQTAIRRRIHGGRYPFLTL